MGSQFSHELLQRVTASAKLGGMVARGDADRTGKDRVEAADI